MSLRSLASMVVRLVELFGLRRREAARDQLTPRVRSLLGAVSQESIREEDYRRHLEEKYR